VHSVKSHRTIGLRGLAASSRCSSSLLPFLCPLVHGKCS
jgi:hypothetical protein